MSEVYDAFVESVARNRGVETAAVRNGFGEGRMVGAYQAKSLGMADRVGTLEETVNRLFKKNAPMALRSAAAESSQSSGQAPASDENVHTQEARARLASVGMKSLEGETTMLRELLNQRNALVTRATALVEAADNENRDLTDDERKEFNELMGTAENPGQVDALDAKIITIQGERERLRTAAGKQFSIPTAEKPEPGKSNVMKRADFDKLNPGLQAAFVKGGGTIEE